MSVCPKIRYLICPKNKVQPSPQLIFLLCHSPVSPASLAFPFHFKWHFPHLVHARCVASRDDGGGCLCRRSPCRGSAAAHACKCWRCRVRRTVAAAPDVLAGGRSAAAHSQRVLDHAMPNTPKHAKTHEKIKNGSFLASYSPPGRAMAKPAGADVAFRRPSF
jgi:hypothetical protein